MDIYKKTVDNLSDSVIIALRLLTIRIKFN